MILNCAFILIYFAKLYAAHPFVLEELNSCNYNSSNDDTSFTSKLWMVEHDNVIIYYTLCGYVQSNICGRDVAACIKDKQHNLIKVLGKKFVLGNDVELSLETEYGSSCKSDPKRQYKLTIKFACFQEVKETDLEISSNDCQYVIHMMNPNSCEPKCTTKVNGQLIDLRPLKRDFFIQSAGRNFSITLCGANQICAYKDISICEITDGTLVPLSEFKNEIMVFNKDRNDIMIRGSYKRPRSKDKKKVELVIKCNWDRNSSNIVDKTLPESRRNYRFEMESSFGCIKLPPNCVITKDFLTYNLTNLHNSSGYLEVSNVPKGNIYLNICGPLRLPRSYPTNICSSSSSQVCEVNNDTFLNKGSTLSNFEIADDIIKATFINGGTCEGSKESSRQHNTHVEFVCSKTEEGPKFVRSEICDTFIHWNTPLACPSYNESRCTYIHQEFKKCSLHLQDGHYDLEPLTLNGSNYDIQDTRNSSILYRLNVCGPVIDSDAPCMKDSMVAMKDLNQYNLKHRVISLGKMDSMVIVNGNIVIKTSSGNYCGAEGDYSSIITFICSDIELQPKLLNRTECTFHFEWKTRHACPIKQTSPVKKCIIENAADNISLNFSKIKQTSLRVNLSKIYDFDLCKENYNECLKEKCTPFPIKKQLLTRGDKTYLDLILPKKCDSETDFNILSFELVCDNIINNEHFTTIGVDNCTLKMELSTSLICSQQHAAIALSRKHKNDKYDIPKEEVLEKDQKNCSVSNHLTGYNFYISNLQLDIPVFHCPVISFYNENSSVMLTYSDNLICQGSKQSGTFEYIVTLKCSEDDSKDLKKTDCSEIYKFEKPEFCKLFETSILDKATASKSNTSNTGKIVGSIVGVLGFFGIGILCFLLHRKYRRTHYNTIYEKDADL